MLKFVGFSLNVTGLILFPEIFNIFFISLIKTGEASGKISESLYYLSDHLEREDDITSKITGALIYPLFVIVVLFAVIAMVVFLSCQNWLIY